MIYNNISNKKLQNFPNRPILEQVMIQHELQGEDDLIEHIQFHCQFLGNTLKIANCLSCLFNIKALKAYKYLTILFSFYSHY